MLKLRLATAADVPTLRHWDTKPHVKAATGADAESDWGWETEVPRQVPWREFLIAELDGRAIGMVQIIDPKEEESHYWGEIEPNLRAIDIWLGEESDLGKGYGTQIMRLAIARCFADQAVEAILIDPLVSNVDALRFYERLGFKQIERRRFGDDDCYVYRLDRT
jgi:aminoglycoside 6'-N-acetyltransferase